MKFRPESARGLAMLAVLLGGFVFGSVEAEERPFGPEMSIAKPLPVDRLWPGTTPFSGPPSDTVWIGHAATPGLTPFLGVHTGGVWDFDADMVPSDTTQGWTRWVLPYRYGAHRPAMPDRFAWHLDYGNMVNRGDVNLWFSRDNQNVRKYVRTGVPGVWHVDPMTPFSAPLAGAGSAWCGLRASGDRTVIDPLTGSAYNADLLIAGTDRRARSEFPGYANQWDQILYKDFVAPASGMISFRYATELASGIDPMPGGSGWFDPDPTDPAHYVPDPEDVFAVYVGSPIDPPFVYDTDRRWFSEVLDPSEPVVNVLEVHGIHGSTPLTVPYSGVQPVGGKIRVAFRVKTNRLVSDEVVYSVDGFNSVAGAVRLDDVSVNGPPVQTFDSPSSILPRSMIGNLSLPAAPWASTGRPPGGYLSVLHMLANNLLYEDVYGMMGSPGRVCNLLGAVIAGSTTVVVDHRGTELEEVFESPTIDLEIRNGPSSGTNAQGLTQAVAQRSTAVLEYDWYAGSVSLETATFWRVGVRYHGPDMVGPSSGTRQWSPIFATPSYWYNGPEQCRTMHEDLTAFGAPIGNIDSLHVSFLVTTLSFGYAAPGAEGDTRGLYFDNVRLGLVDDHHGPHLLQRMADRLQDAFPADEQPVPGSEAFKASTARIVTSRNIASFADPLAVVPGDSLVAFGSTVGSSGQGGARADLVFRIRPGPASYVVIGDPASGLLNATVGNGTFYGQYLANNGTFGTPGGHVAGQWNPNVWNSARMDTAEANLYPVGSRGVGGAYPGIWMGTYHEGDPKFVSLGIVRPICFLTHPEDAIEQSNVTCDGSIPNGYSTNAGSTMEGTKILPDGLFNPGTHIEYFVRSCWLNDPGLAELLPDTSRVTLPREQPLGSADLERFSSLDVLPDLWKSVIYGGQGLACMLFVDAADRRGAEMSYRGAADSLGWGKANGAARGWYRLNHDADTSPDDPSAFVAANLGSDGFGYDHYDIGSGEAVEAAHLGARLAPATGALVGRGDVSAPSKERLARLYSTIVYATGDVEPRVLHAGAIDRCGADDLQTLAHFLDSGTAGSPQGLWLTGDTYAGSSWLHSWTIEEPIVRAFLLDYCGADWAWIYMDVAGSAGPLSSIRTNDAWAHATRYYGLSYRTVWESAWFEDPQGEPVQPWTGSATYDPTQPGIGDDVASIRWTGTNVNGGPRYFTTVTDGFDLGHLRGTGLSAQDPNLAIGDYGRLQWFDDVMRGGLNVCAPTGGMIAVGDLPMRADDGAGLAPPRALPNPAVAGAPMQLRFEVEKECNVAWTIYDVAGRAIATLDWKAIAGGNALQWDGRVASGAPAPPGVYFYEFRRSTHPGAPTRGRFVLIRGAGSP